MTIREQVHLAAMHEIPTAVRLSGTRHYRILRVSANGRLTWTANHRNANELDHRAILAELDCDNEHQDEGYFLEAILDHMIAIPAGYFLDEGVD